MSFPIYHKDTAESRFLSGFKYAEAPDDGGQVFVAQILFRDVFKLAGYLNGMYCFPLVTEHCRVRLFPFQVCRSPDDVWLVFDDPMLFRDDAQAQKH